MSTSGAVSAALLAELPLFSTLSEPERAAIAAIARREELSAGDRVREAGQGDALRVVISGKLSFTVRLPGGGERRLPTLARGESFGFGALLSRKLGDGELTALRPTSVLAIDGAALSRLCEADHALGYHLMRALLEAATDRLSEARLLSLDLYGAP